MTSIRKNVVYITIGMVRKAIALCVMAQQFMPDGKRFGAIVWGQSGIGKNGVTDGIGKDFGAKQGQTWSDFDVNVSAMAPEDLEGLPKIEESRTKYFPKYVLDQKSKGIMRLDELDRPAYFQNLIAVIKFAIDRTVENPLPIDWFVLGLANGTSDTHTQELTEHMQGRFCHLYVSTNSTKAQEERMAYLEKSNASESMKKLCRLNPLHTRDEFEPHAIDNDRTRQYADCVIKASRELTKAGVDCSDILLPVLAGCIGKNLACELIRLESLEGLPSLDEVIANPSKASIPSDLSLRHKYISALVLEAQNDCHKAEALLSYLVRLPNEPARFAIETLTTTCPEICKSNVYVAWANRSK